MATGSVGGNDPVVDRQVLETGWPGRLHGLALRTYPRRFRARFGAALRYDFAQAMADALRRGTVQKYAVALSWSLDALVSGFMERVGLGGGGISMNEAVENDGTRGRSGGNGAGRDVRLAVRRLSRQPGLAAVVILTLGLAIGASSVVFLAMDALFLRPLVYPEAEHLYRLEAGAAGRFDPRISIEDAEDVARLARSVDAIAMIDFGTVSLADGNGPADVVTSAHASASVFDVLGMGPSIGRGFAAGEDAIGRGEVVVLSDGYWRRRFAAQADVVGRTVRIQGVERTIVGVLPPHFEDPATGEQGYADVWLPLAVDESLRSRGTRWARAIARLSPAASREEAAAEVTAIAVRLAEAYPETNEGQALRLVSLREAIWGDARGPLNLMLLATLAVLMIACANLANLFLARATARRHEVAVQRAIGASASAIMRQFLLESVFLALAGGALGVVLTYGASALARHELGARLPRLANASPSFTVLAFATALSLLAALGFGLVPCLRAMRADPAGALDSGRGSGNIRVRRAARRMLVASQVTLSVVLLASAALLLTTLQRLSGTDPGFDARNLLAFDLSLPAADYGGAPDIVALHQQLGASLEAIPGVAAVGAVDKPPLGTRWGCQAFAVEGEPLPQQISDWPCSDTRSITQSYLAATGITIVRGRPFTATDDARGPGVVMINETLAARQWPGDDPIGKRIAWAGELEGDDPWRTVIAVVGDVRHRGPMVEAAPEVYMPFEQAPDRRMTWLVRTTSDPMAVLPAVRRIVADVDPNLPVRRPRAMEAAIGESLSAVRAGAIAIAGLSAFALLLATVGLYGVLSFLVARRTAEFGVRIAFGASVRDIERQVLMEGLTTVGMAVLVGFALAWGAERLLRGTLAGMAEPSMPMLVVIAVLVLGTATVASWLPARRAARLDPATALLVD